MALEFAGADTANTALTTITSGSAGTKGSYTELIASTARASSLFTVNFHGISATEGVELFFATGAAASEVDLFSIMCFTRATQVHNAVTLPFSVASGVRLSAATLSSGASETIGVSVGLSDDDSWGTSSEATLIGASGGKGAIVDPGGSVNTKGSYVELSSSAPHDMDFLVACIGGNENGAVNPQHDHLIDIAIGAASSEVVLVEDIFHVNPTSENSHSWYPIYAPISSGDRVSARAQSNGNNTADRLIDVSVLGVNLTAPTGGGGPAITAFAS
jgi:hypothetical protein